MTASPRESRKMERRAAGWAVPGAQPTPFRLRFCLAYCKQSPAQKEAIASDEEL